MIRTVECEEQRNIEEKDIKLKGGINHGVENKSKSNKGPKSGMISSFCDRKNTFQIKLS